MAVLKQHYNPTPSVIVQRYKCKFHSHSRQPSETIATFMLELRSIAEFCNFGQTLDDMLRDRLVCGIGDNVIQKRLLAEDPLTLAKAMELAQGMEVAAKNTATLLVETSGNITTNVNHPFSKLCKVKIFPVLNPNPGATEVHRLNTTLTPTKPCSHCGKQDHLPRSCRFKEAKCHFCGKIGHLKRVCRKRQAAVIRSQQRSVKCVMEMDENVNNHGKEYSLISLYTLGTTDKTKPLSVDCALMGLT